MRRITDPDGGGSNPSVRASRSSNSRAAPTACAARPGYFVLKKRQGHPPRTEPATRTLHSRWRPHTRGPRSSTDRAPSFYLGTVRVRILPRAPTLQLQCVHVAQMDQSGGVRSLRLRVRIAPWTPLTNAELSTNGELAERQGTAVLTRRDLRVGQVRLLHSPPHHHP
jgi:hypothetical protein